jgi:hypothetical protein
VIFRVRSSGLRATPGGQLLPKGNGLGGRCRCIGEEREDSSKDWIMGRD